MDLPSDRVDGSVPIRDGMSAMRIHRQQHRRAEIRGRLADLRVEQRPIVRQLRGVMAEREALEAQGRPTADGFAEFRP